jgi:hypothetical protein
VSIANAGSASGLLAARRSESISFKLAKTNGATREGISPITLHRCFQPDGSRRYRRASAGLCAHSRRPGNTRQQITLK